MSTALNFILCNMQLQNIKFNAVDIVSDGNCFFRALAAYMLTCFFRALADCFFRALAAYMLTCFFKALAACLHEHQRFHSSLKVTIAHHIDEQQPLRLI